MQTRSDQVQAYRFVTRRIVSALLSGEPETAERPMRRFGLAVMGSAMLAAIVFAGVGVVGFLFPSGAVLPDPGIVIERETGARYVFLNGRLHPVLNYASARLVLGSENPAQKTVSQRSLQDVPRGKAVGIVNAPDPLPARAAIRSGPWSACTLRKSPGSSDFVTHVAIGSVRPGGRPLGDEAMLIRSETSDRVSRWLLWHGHRHRITSDSLTALGLTAASQTPATNAFIDGIPPGPDLAVPVILGLDNEGRVVDGETGRIGEVYRAAGQHYVLLGSGLATIGQVMADLLLASGGSVHAISAAAAADARSASIPNFDPPGFPVTLPQVAFRDAEAAMLCSVFSGSPVSDDVATTVQAYERIGDIGANAVEPAPGLTGPDDVRLADLVEIPGGQATLVRALPNPGDTTPNTTTYLVTDQGKRYALPRVDTDKVLASLGYGGLRPLPVPVFLLALLPLGPSLDPRTAGSPVSERDVPAGPVSPSPTRSSD